MKLEERESNNIVQKIKSNTEYLSNIIHVRESQHYLK